MKRGKKSDADWAELERQLLALLASGTVEAQARRAVAKARADANGPGTPCLTDVRFTVGIDVEVRP
jgi:hypothetical protein